MATWTTRTTGAVIAASHINDLQTGKVDSDGTATPTFATQKIGAGLFSSDDSGILINRTFGGVGAIPGYFAHAVRDESAFSSLTADDAYASFDTAAVISGSVNYNHLAGYQVRSGFGGSGLLGNWIGFWSYGPVVSGAGNVSEAQCFLVSNPPAPSSSGVIGTIYGLYIQALTRGYTDNFAIYSAGDTRSYHHGPLNIGVDSALGNLLDVRIANAIGTNLVASLGSATGGRFQIYNYLASAYANPTGMSIDLVDQDANWRKFFFFSNTGGLCLFDTHDPGVGVFQVDGKFMVTLASVPAAANDAAAASAGIAVGGFYRTNADPSVLCIRAA